MFRGLRHLVIVLFLVAPTLVFSADWYNNDWQYRIKLTTNPAQISGTTNNYVAYVDLSTLPAGFFSNVNASGTDLVVTTGDRVTKLDRDLVYLDTSGSAGELHVRLPQVTSATGTELYLYYLCQPIRVRDQH